MLRTKRRPLINLREWGKKIKLNRNTVLNEKPTEETSTEDSMTFSAPVNEPPSPTYTPVFSPLEEEEDEVKIPKPVRKCFSDGGWRECQGPHQFDRFLANY